MAQHSRECFHIHAVFQRQRREGMAQIMKSNMLAFCVLQNELQSAAHHAGRNGAVLFHRGREHPAGVHRLLYSRSTATTAGGRTILRMEFFVLGVLIWS